MQLRIAVVKYIKLHWSLRHGEEKEINRLNEHTTHTSVHLHNYVKQLHSWISAYSRVDSQKWTLDYGDSYLAAQLANKLHYHYWSQYFYKSTLPFSELGQVDPVCHKLNWMNED